jgi:hypothetical protein
MKKRTYIEPSREIPVIGEYDVVVCGGGPAGCAAAISSARHGAKTLLIEKDGYLGGATVSQLVVVILSTNKVDFQGIWHEYMYELQKRNGVFGPFGETGVYGSVDPEMVKYVWETLCRDSGVNLLYHSYSPKAIVEHGIAKGVTVETKAGRSAMFAKRVIDATGDGIVSAQAGIGYDQGDDINDYAMALTKVFRMGNVKWPENWCTSEQRQQLINDLKAAVDRGEFSTPIITSINRFVSYAVYKHWRLPEKRNEIMCVLSRVLKVNPLDPFAITKAEIEGREQVRQAVEAYCNYVPGFEKAYLVDTSNHIGVRSSRRLHGIATVTEKDADEFKKYPESIAKSSWNIDIWPADSYTNPAVDHTSKWAQARKKRLDAGDYFDIRYGCLVAKGIDNLMMAGRCISAEHVAESSLRIQQTCMSTGQAAGTAAAISIKEGVTPRELDPMKVVNVLKIDRAKVKPAFKIIEEILEKQKNKKIHGN